MRSESNSRVAKGRTLLGDDPIYGGIAKFLLAAAISFRKFCSNNPITFLSIALAAIGLAIVARNEGLYALVLADEYTYSKSARLIALSDSTIPSYLYLFIFRLTNSCGDGFLACARLLNVIFYLSAAPFIFSISSRITSRPVAAFLAIAAILAPTNTYTAYFMPESLYFLFFWIFSWSALKLNYRSTYWSWIFSAIIFSLTALVKPHALFFLPGLILYFAYLIRQRPEQVWVTRWFVISATFVLVALATKMALGFTFAGKAGISLFGPAYGSIASGTAKDLAHYAQLAKLTVVSLSGHVLAMSLLFGTALATILFSLKTILRRGEADNIPLKLAVYALAIFGMLIPVTAMFTASVANIGPYETPFRLHTRYYNFALPLLLMLPAAHLLCSKTKISRPVGSFLAATPLIVAALYAVTTRLLPFTPSFVDNPEIRGMTANPSVFYLLSIVGIGSLVCWIRDHQLGNRIFLFVFIPLLVSFSFFFDTRDMRGRLDADVFDRAGIVAHQYLEGRNASKLAIMGSNPGGLFGTLFYVDNPDATLIDIPKGAAADLSKIPADKEWLLLFDGHAFPGAPEFELPFNGFSLLRIAGSNKIDFTHDWDPGILSRVGGLTNSEPWGRWSDGAAVSLEFLRPLPRKFNLHLTATAFGPNIGRTFTVTVGKESENLVLSDRFEEKTLQFKDPGQATSIRIEVPEPASPQQLGFNGDTRKLGIGLQQLRVEALPLADHQNR